MKPIALREEWRDKMRSQIKLSEDELELFKCQVYDALFNDYNCPSWEQDHQQGSCALITMAQEYDLCDNDLKVMVYNRVQESLSEYSGNPMDEHASDFCEEQESLEESRRSHFEKYRAKFMILNTNLDGKEELVVF